MLCMLFYIAFAGEHMCGNPACALRRWDTEVWMAPPGQECRDHR